MGLKIDKKNLTPYAEFLAKRREKIIKPIMDEFYNWMIETRLTVPESFKFGQALKYAITAWPQLMNYLDCPEIYLDNSISERSIKTGWTDSNWSELLPWNIQLIKRSDVSAVSIA